MKKVQRFGSYCDKSRGGFGSSWRAMRAVLSAKFELHRDILLSTKEAFLLDTGGRKSMRLLPPNLSSSDSFIYIYITIYHYLYSLCCSLFL